MTNDILGQGYDCVYQRAGVVHTLVPTTYKRLCKMFLRWDRSYVREEIKFLRSIVWKRPVVTRVVALMDRIISNLRYPVLYVAIASLPALVWHDPRVLPRLLLAMGLVSALNTFHYLRSERSLDFFYGVLYSYFWFFTLSWIFPYAALTARARSWLTR